MAIRNKKDLVYRVGDEEDNEAGHEARRVTVEWASREWLEEIAKSRKDATHRFYCQRVAVFAPWSAANEIEYLDQITPTVARKYRNWRIKHAGVSAGTARHDEVTLKQITKYAAKMKWVAYDPLRDYDPLPAPTGNEREAAEPLELDKILAVIEKTRVDVGHKPEGDMRYTKARDRMVLLTEIETGGRSGEVLSMTKSSLLRDRGMIEFRRSGMADTRKNKQDLTVHAQDYWWQEIDAYLAIRAPMEHDDDLVFPTLTGSQMTSRAWAQRFAKYAKKAGVAGLTSHCIRHMVGGQVAEAKGLFAVSRQLGHRSEQSSARYAKHAGKNDPYMKEVHDAVSPLSTFARATGRLVEETVKKAVHRG